MTKIKSNSKKDPKLFFDSFAWRNCRLQKYMANQYNHRQSKFSACRTDIEYTHTNIETAEGCLFTINRGMQSPQAIAKPIPTRSNSRATPDLSPRTRSGSSPRATSAYFSRYSLEDTANYDSNAMDEENSMNSMETNRDSMDAEYEPDGGLYYI